MHRSYASLILCFASLLAPLVANAEDIDVKILREGSGYKYLCIDGIVFLENKNGNFVQLLLNKPGYLGDTAVMMECVPCKKFSEWLNYYKK